MVSRARQARIQEMAEQVGLITVIQSKFKNQHTGLIQERQFVVARQAKVKNDRQDNAEQAERGPGQAKVEIRRSVQ